MRRVNLSISSRHLTLTPFGSSKTTRTSRRATMSNNIGEGGSVSPSDALAQLKSWGIPISGKEAEHHLQKVQKPLYRIVDEREHTALIQGKRITRESMNLPARAGYGDGRIDVTSDPGYHGVLRNGKYLITFKESCFHTQEKERITVHNLEKSEFYLYGGYSLDDVSQICDATTNEVVWPPNETKLT